MALTDTAVRNAKPREKQYKISDERGLFLLIAPGGGKWWRFRYRFGGKAKAISLGVYPDISLKEARARRDEARNLVANSIDPSAHRQAAKQAEEEVVTNSFRSVALEWLPKMTSRREWAPSYSKKVTRRLEVDLFPWLGDRPVGEITPPELLKVLQRIEDRGAINTAHQAKQTCGQIFRYAIATGRAERDPSADLKDALPPARSKHFASITDPKAVGELLRAIDGFKGTFVVQCALRLSPLFFVRPGELRKAEWEHINLEKAEWRFTATKTRTEHLVPLARQAVTILRELHPYSGEGRFVFPGRDPKQPMSEAAVNASLRRLGYDTKTDITGHGFRAMARTIIAEELHVKPEVIEHQLAHKVPDILGTAYNRTKFLKERRAMMQQWADYLERLKNGAEIIPLQKEA